MQRELIDCELAAVGRCCRIGRRGVARAEVTRVLSILRSCQIPFADEK